MVDKPEDEWVATPNTQEAIGELAGFVRCYEPVFLYLIAQNSAKGRKQEMKELKLEIETGRRCIEIRNSDRSTGHVRVKVDIYFTAVRMIDLPTEAELKALMEDMQNAPIQDKATAWVQKRETV